MKRRALILTAGFGEGHNAAACALAAAFDAAEGTGCARVVDPFALAQPRLNVIARRAYLEGINQAPRLWKIVYQWLDRSPAAEHVRWFLRRELRVIRQQIAEHRPMVICSTYPIHALLLRDLARRGVRLPPLFNIVTDSISINSLWWRGGGDGWFVPNEDSARVMRERGVDPARLHVSGFPVASFFAAERSRLAPPDLGESVPPRVLYIVNSRTPAAAETARRLLTDTKWDVTCAVGRNEALASELMRLATERREPARILGWTMEIPRLLMTHHVVISKAGGATTQEALAAGCPMIVNQIVPGQEEGNYELLRRHGIGARADNPAEVLAVLERAFADRGRLWREWRQALQPLSRPRAAASIVETIFNALPSLARSGISAAAGAERTAAAMAYPAI